MDVSQDKHELDPSECSGLIIPRKRFPLFLFSSSREAAKSVRICLFTGMNLWFRAKVLSLNRSQLRNLSDLTAFFPKFRLFLIQKEDTTSDGNTKKEFRLVSSLRIIPSTCFICSESGPFLFQLYTSYDNLLFYSFHELTDL